jgi:hypothetical protein
MRGRPFEQGNKMSKGRPPGSRNQRSVLAETMGSHGVALVKQCQVLAMKGNTAAMRLCMERLLPPCKASNSRFVLPAVKTAADIGLALQSVLQEVARGRLSAQEGEAISVILENHRRAIETEAFGKRLEALEQKSLKRSQKVFKQP